MNILKTNTTTELTEDQKDMLFFIYQEEKLARDVCITLSKIHKDEFTFTFMQIEEQKHVDSARELCNTYGVKTSYADEGLVGKFESPVLQTLYAACIEKGKRSLHDALEVGEFIEMTDIEELEQASIGMPNDIVQVYEKLKQGNLNHLNALQSAMYRAA